jgi:predicted permease
VTAQIAFTFILVMGAVLLVSSLRHLLAVDPGFRADGVVTARFNIPMLRYPNDEDARVFSERMMDAVRRVPGVISAGLTTMTPLGGSYSRRSAFPAGYSLSSGESLVSPLFGVVTPGYFEAMSTSLIKGRYFSESDTRTSEHVAIVDEKLARKFWPGTNPVGKRLYLPNNSANPVAIDAKTVSYTVVGVVGEVRLEDLSGNPNPAGAFYIPFSQAFTRGYRFAIKSPTDPASLVSALRSEVRKVDPETPIFEVRTMGEWVDSSLITRKAGMLLALSFAGISLFLSAVGIYGVLAYLVTQRTREIGIRIALGSSVPSIFKLIFSEGLLLVAAGLVLGVAGTVALRGTLAGELYGVEPTDPFVIGLVMALLGGIALAASVIPARRATQVNPITVLNQQ